MNASQILMQRGLILFAILFFFSSATLLAAPRGYGNDDTANTLREMRGSVTNIQHEVENHETEIHMLSERINNQENTISSLRQQVLDSSQSNKDMIRGNSSTIETKLNSLENANKSLIADLQQLKTHANETAAALTKYKTHISELENVIKSQNQNIDNLQAATRSLMEALEIKEGIISSTNANVTTKSYRVQSGDNLEKIAKVNNTTIKALKELNSLTNDRIRVGQKLQLP
jgi:LysM repeat protein